MFTFDSFNKKLGYHQIKILINTGMVDIFYSIIYHNYAQSSTKQVRYKQFHLNPNIGPKYISVKKEKKALAASWIKSTIKHHVNNTPFIPHAFTGGKNRSQATHMLFSLSTKGTVISANIS